MKGIYKIKKNYWMMMMMMREDGNRILLPCLYTNCQSAKLSICRKSVSLELEAPRPVAGSLPSCYLCVMRTTGRTRSAVTYTT